MYPLQLSLSTPLQYHSPLFRTSVYLDRISAGHTSWPVSPLVDGLPDIENITAALKVGPYGQCVYDAPNDVVDNQVVNRFVQEFKRKYKKGKQISIGS